MKNNLKEINVDFTVVKKEENYRLIIDNNEEKIIVYQSSILEKMVSTKFNDHYQKLLYITNDIMESDDSTDSDSELVLFKIEELKDLLINKYANLISKNLLNKYLKMLMVLDQKLNLKPSYKRR